MREEIGFWLAVVFVAIAGIAGFKLLATTQAGDAWPALRKFAAFV